MNERARSAARRWSTIVLLGGVRLVDKLCASGDSGRSPAWRLQRFQNGSYDTHAGFCCSLSGATELEVKAMTNTEIAAALQEGLRRRLSAAYHADGWLKP